MSVTISASTNSSPIRLLPGESIAFTGVLTGTATLTPKLSSDGGAAYYAMSDPSTLTSSVAFTATFGWVELKAPTKTPPTYDHWLFRLENSSGGSWAVEGIPAA